MNFGYIRVSTKEQNIGRQYEALEKYSEEKGFSYDQIFIDKKSGKNFERENYLEMLRKIKPGDRVVVKELDRLGRSANYEDIKNEIYDLNSRDVKLVILDLPMFDVDDPSLNKLLTNLTIEILSYIASKEREKTVNRVKEGLLNARQNGKTLGRPKRELPGNFYKYYSKWKDKEITAVEFSKLLGISRATLYRYIDQYEKVDDIKK